MYPFCKQYIILIFFSLVTFVSQANDSSYYGSGNQLIPISENDITVSKEILTIKRNQTDKDLVDVTVYYEFFNSGKPKDIVVGFEAFSPSGDAAYLINKKGNIYMTNFNIDMNGQKLPYEVTIVTDSVYFRNGVINAITQKQFDIIQSEEDWINFFYVYHFNAHFKTGLNVITHTYTYELSGSVERYFDFQYVLSAAIRWGNKQIDDFTLNIDLGNDQLIYIPQTFFDNTSQWIIDGIGKAETLDYGDGAKISSFYVREGKLIFKKMSFKPRGELNFYSPVEYFGESDFNYQNDKHLPYRTIFSVLGLNPTDETSLKVLRNLPFAYRGYVFSDSELQHYFEQQIWYYPDPSYKVDMTQLSDDEKEYLDHWTNYQLKSININEVFDYQKSPNIFYYVYLDSKSDVKAANDISKKILRNLPFAFRGYVFSNPDLQHYFENQTWYKPNKNYKAEINDLSEKERIWINKYD